MELRKQAETKQVEAKQMGARKQAESKVELQVINTRRNPYLVDYGQERRTTKSRVTKSRAIRRRRRLERQLRRRRRLAKGLAVLCIALLFFCFIKHNADAKRTSTGTATTSVAEGIANALTNLGGQKIQGLRASDYEAHPTWTEDFLTPNEYSRPGEALEEVNNIFVHYTANPGTGAAQNRSYFEQLKDTHERSASAHFIIGYEGEIIQCIPLDEIAYAVKTRNYDSISIECCYKAENGQFTQETYDSLIELLRWLTEVYDLERDDILRHYDCGGKKCPLYYVEHEDAWEQLKREVVEE